MNLKYQLKYASKLLINFHCVYVNGDHGHGDHGHDDHGYDVHGHDDHDYVYGHDDHGYVYGHDYVYDHDVFLSNDHGNYVNGLLFFHVNEHDDFDCVNY